MVVWSGSGSFGRKVDVIEKKCKCCGKTKALDQFYKNSQRADGHLNRCKDCHSATMKKWRAANADRIREYAREYNNRPDVAKKRTDSIREWKAADPRIGRCHSAVRNALKAGKLVREPCETCGAEKTVAHHDDYDQPLNVRWLCPPCHVRHHLALRQQEPDDQTVKGGM